MGRPRTSNTDLPANVQKKGGSYYFIATHQRRRLWISLGAKKWTALKLAAAFVENPKLLRARIERAILRAESSRDSAEGGSASNVGRAPKRVSSFSSYADPGNLALLHGRVRAQAKARGIPFDLQIRELSEIVSASDGRCAVSGIQFSMTPKRKGEKRPWAPSIDRIDSNVGYTKGNIRVVCVAVNYALNTFGEDALARIAIGVLRKQRGAFHSASERPPAQELEKPSTKQPASASPSS